MAYQEIDLGSGQLLSGGAYSGGVLSDPADFNFAWIPGFTLRATETYELVIDYMPHYDGTGQVTLYSSGPSWGSSYGYTLHASVTFDAAVAGVAGSVSLTMGPGQADFDTALAAGENYVYVEVLQVDITGARISGVVDGLTPAPTTPPIGTDSVNRANGRTRVCEWTVDVEPPVTEPKRQRAHDYAIAVSITEPTLVDGRPT